MYNGKIWCFGGRDDNTRYNSMHSFDLRTNTWSLVDQRGDVPSARTAHRGVIYKDHWWIYGGTTLDGITSGDFFKFDFGKFFLLFVCSVFCSHNFFPASEKWERISWKGEGPKPKTGHFMWIDGGHLYICCGEDSAEMDVNFNDEGFWRIDLDKVVAHQVEWERVSLKHTSLSVHFLDGVQAKVGAHVFFLMSRQMHVYTPSEGEVRVVSAAPAESQSCMVALDGVLYLVPEKSFNYCECSTLSSFVFFKLHYTLFTRFFLHFIVFIVTLPTWSLGGEI